MFAIVIAKCVVKLDFCQSPSISRSKITGAAQKIPKSCQPTWQLMFDWHFCYDLASKRCHVISATDRYLCLLVKQPQLLCFFHLSGSPPLTLCMRWPSTATETTWSLWDHIEFHLGGSHLKWIWCAFVIQIGFATFVPTFRSYLKTDLRPKKLFKWRRL